MKNYYKLIPLCDRPRLLENHDEAMAATKNMRERNRGFYLYEVTEQDNKKETVFIVGWNPRA